MVLIILLGFSVISWAIIAAKVMLLRRTKKEMDLFFRSYEQQPTFSAIYKDIEAQALHNNPFAAIFLKGYRELLRISSAPPGTRSQEGGAVREPARLTVEWTGLESVERQSDRREPSRCTDTRRPWDSWLLQGAQLHLWGSSARCWA